MELRQLKYFIAVAEELNFGRAAARLHLSQPPVTRQIQALEDELGAQLFVRTPKGVVLTPAGEALLRDAISIRTLVAQAVDRAQRAGRGQTGVLDVGVYGSSALNIVPKILAAFTKTHPDVKILLHNAHRSLQIEALRQGRILIAFDRYIPDDEDLAVERVARERLLVALHANHPLASRPVISVGDLRGEPMIMPGGLNALTANVALSLCRAHGLEPNVAREVSDVITGVTLVACDQGLALVPESATSFQLPSLVYRPLKEGNENFMELHCLYLKREQSPLLRELLQTVRSYRQTMENVPRDAAGTDLPPST